MALVVFLAAPDRRAYRRARSGAYRLGLRRASGDPRELSQQRNPDSRLEHFPPPSKGLSDRTD
jgi:hypothetical protein